MAQETNEQKIARLEREKKRLQQEAEENMMIGFALGTGPGKRATRMYGVGEITGAFD